MFHHESKTLASSLTEQKSQTTATESETLQLVEIGRLLADILYLIHLEETDRSNWKAIHKPLDIESLSGDMRILAHWLFAKYPKYSNKVINSGKVELELAKELMADAGIERLAFFTVFSSHLTTDPTGIIWNYYSIIPLKGNQLEAVKSLFAFISTLPLYEELSHPYRLNDRQDSELRRIVSLQCHEGDTTQMLLNILNKRNLSDSVKAVIQDYKLGIKPEVLSLAAIDYLVRSWDLEFLVTQSSHPNPEYNYGDGQLTIASSHMMRIKYELNQGCIPLSAIVAAAQVNNLSGLKILLQDPRNRGALDKVDISGQTPLHAATQHTNKEIVKFLLEQKANPLVKDAKGRTALENVTQRRTEIIKLNKILKHDPFDLQGCDAVIPVLKQSEKQWQSMKAAVAVMTRSSGPGLMPLPSSSTAPADAEAIELVSLRVGFSEPPSR
ncbi:MAG: ankyrin repeat domain-containing protein [Gammaproteobacteria bacterium]